MAQTGSHRPLPHKEMALQNMFGQYCSLCRSVNGILGVIGIGPKDGRMRLSLTMSLRVCWLPVGRHGKDVLGRIRPSHKGSLVPFFVECCTLGRSVGLVQYNRSMRREMFRLQQMSQYEAKRRRGDEAQDLGI